MHSLKNDLFQLDYVDPVDDRNVDVIFTIYDADTNEKYDAAEAEAVFERIDRAELSSYVGATVRRLPCDCTTLFANEFSFRLLILRFLWTNLELSLLR
jgi:hypothetical protein